MRAIFAAGTEPRHAVPALAVAAALVSSVCMVLPRTWGLVLVLAPLLAIALTLVREPRRILLAGIAFALPLNISKTLIGHAPHVGGAEGLVLSLLDIPLLCLGLIWAWEALEKKSTRSRLPVFYTVSIGAFLLIALVSATQSTDVSLSLFEVLRTVRGVLILVYVAKHVDLRRDLGLLLTALLLGFTLLGAETVTNQALGTSFNLSAAGRGESTRWAETVGGSEIIRVGGSLGSPNALASYVALLLPVSFCLLCSRIRPALKAAVAVVFGLGLATLILTMSRGAWLGTGLALSLVLVLAAYRRMISRRTVIATFTLSGVAILVANLLMGGIIWLRLTASQTQNVTSRYEFADIALKMIRARPLLGIGLNNFAETMSGYDVTGLTSQLLTSSPPVHNIYLLVASEVGILGFAVFMVFVLALLVDSLRTSARATGVEAWVLLGIFGGIVTILVQGMVDFAFRLDATFYTFWFLAGLTISSVIGEANRMRTDARQLDEVTGT